MAWIVADSFDYYASVADVARSVWDSVAGPTLLLAGASTRFTAGQAIQVGGTTVLQKTVASNEAVLFLAVAYYRPNALSGTTPETFWQLRDGTTAQCTVVFESSGNIVLKSGIHTGTVLATYTGAFVQDVWTHFQIRVVIDGAAGSMTVRKNGQTSDTYASATNLNTRGGTANNYANVVVLGGASSAQPYRVDDLLMFSGSGAAPNTWVGDVRAVCLAPAADTAQKQFTPSAATQQVGTGTTGTAQAFAVNVLRFGGTWTPARSGQLQKASLTFASGATGNFQVAIYAADGPNGIPGTLIASSAVVVNPVTGVNDFTFTGGPWLVQGRLYWFGYLADASPASGINAAAAPLAHYSIARTYASGFPATAPTAGYTIGTLPPWGNLTLAGNVQTISEALANGDTDYVFDATVGDSDLYDMDDLQFTPQAVIGVVSKIYCKKSDAGSRNGQILVSSGGTQVAGADTVLSSTYTYLSKVDPVDPNTSAAWTLAAVNAAKVGQKVSA